jgi:hypothetical protein
MKENLLMARTRWLGWCPILLGLLAGPAPAAEESPLAQVPARAPIVISLHGVKRTTDRLVTMVKKAVPDLGRQVEAQIRDFFEKGFFEGRKLRGLVDDGHIFVVLTQLPKPQDEEGPAIAVIARVTDYKAFRDSLMTEDERRTLKADARAGYDVAQVRDKDM